MRSLEPSGHQWSQGTRWSLDHGRIAIHLLESGLESERADGGADALEAFLTATGGTQSDSVRQIAAELLAGPAQGLLAPVHGHLVKNSADQGGKATGWQLERVQLRHRRVELRRSPGTGAAAARSPGKGRFQQPGAQEPLKTAASDSGMNAQGRRRVGGRHRVTRAPDKHEGGSQPAACQRIEMIHPTRC